ncbi:MAG: aminopeptidase, partial [Clostridiales bacterium 43-6]
MSEKTKAAMLKDKLFIQPKNGCLVADDTEINEAYQYCEHYKTFMDRSKTERTFTINAVSAAEKAGFVPYDNSKTYQPGDRVYLVNRGKSVIFTVFGTESMDKGVRILGAHIDSPRIDLKQRPLYEDSELALFKTHYYGGIKKYQWTAVPLMLQGVIIKSDGTALDITIGDTDSDPKFTVTDLLPHLAMEQSKRTLSDGIKGEELNILVGSRPFRDDKQSELVKLNILNLLHEKYGIIEEDFTSAELSLVPAHKASDIGFDRSLVGSYGQDDRVCAYTSFTATFDTKTPTYTVITLLADKEEVGSDGNTGTKSAFFQNFINDIAKAAGTEGYRVLSRSKCLSADVSVALDPTFADVTERNNTAYLNHGVVITKYTGSRGKADTSDASAEFTGEVRKILNDAKILWQTGELGKVDAGGGGTVAKYIANLDVDVIDVGVPVLSMHSPYEITAKLDIYMAYKAFMA